MSLEIGIETQTAAKAVNSDAAEPLLACVNHEKVDKEWGHFSIDRLKDNQASRVTTTQGVEPYSKTGDQDFYISLNGKNYYDQTNPNGTESIQEVPKEMGKVFRPVTQDTDEYKDVKKALDDLNAKDVWDKLPNCEIK